MTKRRETEPLFSAYLLFCVILIVYNIGSLVIEGQAAWKIVLMFIIPMLFIKFQEMEVYLDNINNRWVAVVALISYWITYWILAMASGLIGFYFAAVASLVLVQYIVPLLCMTAVLFVILAK